MNMRTLVASASLVLLAGCLRGGKPPQDSRSADPQMQEVTGRIFELEYAAPRTPFSQWRYRGVVDGYHVLDYYGRGLADQAELRHSIRTRAHNLSKDFPTQPQPPVKETLSREEEQYFEMLRTETMREKQMRGETATDW